MDKTLVAYFSASGVTASLAKTLAGSISADLFEIRPKKPYTSDDLNWNDKTSRSTVEMEDKTFRPAIADDCRISDMGQYDTIFLGFPIWWYVAPTIINTFLEQYNLTGKTVIPFATSGMSGMGNTNHDLKPSCPGAVLKEGQRFAANTGADKLRAWVEANLR